MEKTFNINGNEIKVQEYTLKESELSFKFQGKEYSFSLIHKNGPEMIIDNGERFSAAASMPGQDGECMVLASGREALVMEAGRKRKKDRTHSGGLTSPMPGKVFKLIKGVGSMVKKGETILILEAMKMEHSIRADKDGKITSITYQEGELVQGGVVLVELE